MNYKVKKLVEEILEVIKSSDYVDLNDGLQEAENIMTTYLDEDELENHLPYFLMALESDDIVCFDGSIQNCADRLRKFLKRSDISNHYNE